MKPYDDKQKMDIDNIDLMPEPDTYRFLAELDRFEDESRKIVIRVGAKVVDSNDDSILIDGEKEGYMSERKKYYYVQKITEVRGEQFGYVDASSLEEAKRFFLECKNITIEDEHMEATELGEVKWLENE